MKYYITSHNLLSFLYDKIHECLNRGNRFLIAPLNDGFTEPAQSGIHWGLIIIDCQIRNWMFIDPYYDTGDFAQDGNIIKTSLLTNVLSIVVSVLSILEFEPIVFPVTRKQTPNDCGIYVIEYIHQFLNIQNELPSLSHAEASLLNMEIDALAVRNEIYSYLESLNPPEEEEEETEEEEEEESEEEEQLMSKESSIRLTDLPPKLQESISLYPPSMQKDILIMEESLHTEPVKEVVSVDTLVSSSKKELHKPQKVELLLHLRNRIYQN
ncbi:hypothetical protein GEMRC1_012973 [Eukaryota sp. GEM-RC1]